MYRNLLFASFLLFVLFPAKSFAFIFPPDKHESDSIRNLYVKDIKTKFAFSLTYGALNSSLLLTSRGKSPKVLSYSDQSPLQIGLNASIWILSIPVSFSPSFLENKTSQVSNIRISPSTFGKWIWWNAEFNYNRGFAINNLHDIANTYLVREVDYKYVRPDIRAYSFASSLTFVTNGKRFSSSSVFSFTSKQLRSAGSLLLGVNSHVGYISADSSVVPSQYKTFFPRDQAFINSRTISVGFSLGYTYTLVFAKNLFANLTVLPSLCTQTGYTITASKEKTRRNKFLTPGDGFGYFALGRNGFRCYWGASLNAHAYRESPSGSNLLLSYVTPSIFFGYRFLEWSTEQLPPLKKKDKPSKFAEGEKVTWWADGYKHTGKIIAVYKHEFYRVKEDITKREYNWQDFDLEKKGEKEK